MLFIQPLSASRMKSALSGHSINLLIFNSAGFFLYAFAKSLQELSRRNLRPFIRNHFWL